MAEMANGQQAGGGAAHPSTGEASTGSASTGSAGGGGGATFEGWLAEQGEDVRGLYDGHVKGLKTALASEREARQSLEKQLREAAKNAEGANQTALTEMADKLALADRRTAFYEMATDAGVRNLRLAWLAVQNEEDLVDRRGTVDLKLMKERYPELFGTKSQPPAGNAGAGTGAEPGSKQDMNAFIRRAAGR